MASYGKELGQTGLQEFAGQINDDFLREFRGKEAYKRYDEMRRNSPIIAALLLANEQAIRKVSWEFTSDRGKDDPRVDLLNAARDNLSLSWNDHISEALTMLPFGFAIFEIVYERTESNVWLWRKFAPRGQDTVYRWEFDEGGGLAGVHQLAAPKYEHVFLPIEKLLIYRTRVERGNPEGRSILRAAWVPYYYAKHIMQIEAVGIERDLAGLPVITLPEGADTSDNDTSDLGKAEKVVRNIRNDEQAGLTLPSGWKFELASTGGARAFDTDKIVRRYESRMLMAALAQFLMLGQENVGSFALSKDQTDFFTMSVNAVADIIAETFTKYAIPRLLALNGYDAEGVRLEHTPAGDKDADMLTSMLQKVGGYVTWSTEDELWLRQVLDMPEKSLDEIEAAREDAERRKMERAKAFMERSAPKPEEDGSKRDDSRVTLFVADPPDKKKRERFEREWKRAIEAIFERQRKRVMSAAKEMRNAKSV